MLTLWIILGIVILVALFAIAVYNRLIGLRNQVRDAWSGIDVQLKRRYNLIPNMVETVKGYAKQESSVLENVTKARNMAVAAKTPAEHGKAENMLTDTLKSLFAVAEAYPDLKSDQNFLDLQRELSMTEDKIQAARRFYNGTVRDYNTKLEVFPNNLLAGTFRFKKEEFFQIEGTEEEIKEQKAVPDVKF
ncbi:MAG: LemA family protein [bacterium]|nr:LemA family protein [bacterium]